MNDLQGLMARSAECHHDHLCPRQVLGVRMGMYVAELLNLDLPQKDKRLFTFIETDGCLVDGVGVATGCWVGNRTMRVLDYGKSAATFVDTLSERAIRVTPHPQARLHAAHYAPDAPDRWHAQLAAYQIMPINELLLAQEVALAVPLAAIISQHGKRTVCERCGEDVINGRWQVIDGKRFCRACAYGAYYAEVDGGSSLSIGLTAIEST